MTLQSIIDDKDELFDKTTNINNGNGAPTYHNMTQRNEEELLEQERTFMTMQLHTGVII